MGNDDKRNIDPIQEMLRLAGDFTGLKTWGFKESYRSLKGRELIYDSEWCRFQIKFDGWEPPHQASEFSVDIYYGRLHAADEKGTIIWENEECHCWHNIVKVLHFLDGREPEYVVKNLYSHDLIKKYSSLVKSKSLVYKLSEWEIRKHAYIWADYAPRLFELFDLRRPDLWEQYRQFLKEVYDIKGRNPNIHPSFDHVC